MGIFLREGAHFLLQNLRIVWYSLHMTTTHLPIARTDDNGTTWYPVRDGQGFTSNIDFAAPHVLAMDEKACIVIVPDITIPPMPVIIVKGSHAACSHESTKAARAACRKSRAAVA